MSRLQTQNERVVRYYHATRREYQLFWMGPEDHAMHFGYYNASVKSHAASLLKMNEVLADLDASFDVIWALESLVHTDRKAAFIHEAARLLRCGERLLIAEYMLRDDPPLSEAETAFLSPWLKGWAMADLLTAGEYQSLLEAEGFANVQVDDLTAYVRPSVDHLGKLRLPTKTAAIAILPGRIFQRFHIVSKERVNNIEAGLYLHKALSRNLWRYIVIRAAKKDNCDGE